MERTLKNHWFQGTRRPFRSSAEARANENARCGSLAIRSSSSRGHDDGGVGDEETRL